MRRACCFVSPAAAAACWRCSAELIASPESECRSRRAYEYTQCLLPRRRVDELRELDTVKANEAREPVLHVAGKRLKEKKKEESERVSGGYKDAS